MLEFVDNASNILKEVVRMKPGQKLLVITDTYARSRAFGTVIAEVANSMGVESVLTMMQPITLVGQEPPPAIAAAMKEVDVVLEFAERHTIVHSNARKEATAVGVRHYIMNTEASEDRLRTPIKPEDLKKIQTQTDKLAGMVTKAKAASVKSSWGTDITMSLEGRGALSIHPLSALGFGGMQDYAEAAIAPVEGTTEGLVIVDASVRGWGYILRSPISFEIKKGRVQVETVSSDVAEEAERFKKIVLHDENASNCAAELGLGTSHTVPRILCGDSMCDYARSGNVHIAVGRNNDIGGETFSQIHIDVLMTRATVKLDDVCVVENGELVI
jgi:leucyl aminopeptidase (aminopeptidase T)